MCITNCVSGKQFCFPVKFAVSTVVTMKNAVFRDVIACGSYAALTSYC
jgi:hypothetical protein